MTAASLKDLVPAALRADVPVLPPLNDGGLRLRHAFLIRCERVELDEAGRVVEVGCSYDPDSLGKNPEGRRVKGTLHWVSAAAARDAEVRLYDRLFKTESPGAEGHDFKEDLNPQSLVTVAAKVEQCVADAPAETHFQFERQGFFFSDPIEHGAGRVVYNRVVSLKDTWAKLSARTGGGAVSVPKKVATVSPKPTKGALSDDAKGLVEAHGIGEEEARVLSDSDSLKQLFDAAIASHDNARSIASWIVNELRAFTKEQVQLPFGGKEIAELVEMIDAKTISGTTAKAVLGYMAAGEGTPRGIVEERGLKITDNGKKHWRFYQLAHSLHFR